MTEAYDNVTETNGHMTKPTSHMTIYLDVKPCLLQVSDQREAATDGVRLALPDHLPCSIMEVLESHGVKVAGNALREGGGGGRDGKEGGDSGQPSLDKDKLSDLSHLCPLKRGSTNC